MLSVLGSVGNRMQKVLTSSPKYMDLLHGMAGRVNSKALETLKENNPRFHVASDRCRTIAPAAKPTLMGTAARTLGLAAAASAFKEIIRNTVETGHGRDRIGNPVDARKYVVRPVEFSAGGYSSEYVYEAGGATAEPKQIEAFRELLNALVAASALPGGERAVDDELDLSVSINFRDQIATYVYFDEDGNKSEGKVALNSYLEDPNVKEKYEAFSGFHDELIDQNLTTQLENVLKDMHEDASDFKFDLANLSYTFTDASGNVKTSKFAEWAEGMKKQADKQKQEKAFEVSNIHALVAKAKPNIEAFSRGIADKLVKRRNSWSGNFSRNVGGMVFEQSRKEKAARHEANTFESSIGGLLESRSINPSEVESFSKLYTTQKSYRQFYKDLLYTRDNPKTGATKKLEGIIDSLKDPSRDKTEVLLDALSREWDDLSYSKSLDPRIQSDFKSSFGVDFNESYITSYRSEKISKINAIKGAADFDKKFDELIETWIKRVSELEEEIQEMEAYYSDPIRRGEVQATEAELMIRAKEEILRTESDASQYNGHISEINERVVDRFKEVRKSDFVQIYSKFPLAQYLCKRCTELMILKKISLPGEIDINANNDKSFEKHILPIYRELFDEIYKEIEQVNPRMSSREREHVFDMISFAMRNLYSDKSVDLSGSFGVDPKENDDIVLEMDFILQALEEKRVEKGIGATFALPNRAHLL